MMAFLSQRWPRGQLSQLPAPPSITGPETATAEISSRGHQHRNGMAHAWRGEEQ